MGSISNPSGPSITGYTQPIITNEISSTLLAYNNAKAAFTAAQTTFNATPSNITYRDDLKNAVSNLQIAATAYGTALARQQLFTDQQSSVLISTTISALAGQALPVGSEFVGLTTQVALNLSSEDSAKETARSQLINAFNAYRFTEWKIANTRAEIIKQQADQAYAIATSTPFDNTQLTSLNASLTTLLTVDRPTNTQLLNQALSQYSTTFGAIDSELVTAIAAARTQAETWADYIATAQAASSAYINSLFQQAQTNDQTATTIHYSQYEDTNATATGQALDAANNVYITTRNQLSASGPGNVTSSSPSLPPSRKILSMAQLMQIVSEVQLAMSELSKQMNDADRRINSFRREVAFNEMLGGVNQQIALDDWARTLASVDSNFNKQVDKDNTNTFGDVTDIYNIYQQNTSVINSVIDQINLEIDQQNARNKALVDAANSLNPAIVATINSSNQNKADTTNVLDYTNIDPDSSAPTPETVRTPLTYPPDIPHYPYIGSYPAAPTADLSSDPPTFPTQAEIDAFNNNVIDIAKKIAPFTERVQKALQFALSGSTTNFARLQLQEFFLRPYITVRDTTIKSSYDGFLQLFPAFQQQILSMRRGTEAQKNELEPVIVSVAKKLETATPDILPSDIKGSSTTNVVAGVGLTTADVTSKPSAVGRVIESITSSSEFKEVIQSLLERGSIQAGLETIGTIPSVAKQISSLGIPFSETLLESGIDIGKIIEKKSIEALVTALLRNLSAGILNTKELQANALTLLKDSIAAQALSKKELHDALGQLIALQQLVLLLTASFLGVSSGFSAGTIISGFGGTSTVNNTGAQATGGGDQSSVDTNIEDTTTEDELVQNIAEDDLTQRILSDLVKKDAISRRQNTQDSSGTTQSTADENSQDIQNEDIQDETDPTTIANQLRDEFQSLPQEVQNQIRQGTSGGDDTTSGLVSALASGKISPKEAGYLNAVLTKNAAIHFASQASAFASDTAKSLFRKSEEQTQIEEDNAKYDLKMEDIERDATNPLSITNETRDLMQSAFKTTSFNFADRRAAMAHLESFTKSISKMSNFNEVAVHSLLDPGKSILREFSIITRSAGDRAKQSPIILGG